MICTADLRAKAILSRLGANPVGAELGIYRGSLSRRLLARRDLTLHMVDTWGVYKPTYAASGDWLATGHDETEWHNIREGADVHTRFAEERRRIIQSDSADAADEMEDGSLDFVFIDADHSYAGCKRDIEAWFPKLKAGGLLCGHDYEAPDFTNWAVKRAVDEFAGERGLTVETGDDDTWFIRLPGPVPQPSKEYDQIIVACVKHGTKYNSSYVNILADMVARNCELPYQFWCFTDDASGLAEEVQAHDLPPGLEGWWNKVALFKADLFPANTRIVFLDLDVIVCGPIEDLVNTKGIAADWLQGGYNSSVMVWDAGEHRQVWDHFKPDTAGRLHGDQDWITECSTWTYLPSDWIVSYRLHAVEWPPENAKIVAMHGEPKPADIKTGWVPEMWTMAGLAIPRYTSVLNNDITTIRANVVSNSGRVPALTIQEPHDRTLIIAAGGPSLARTLPQLQLERVRAEYDRGSDLWSVNGTHDFLISRGIQPDAMLMLDSRKQCVETFLSNPLRDVEYLIATQCDPSAFDVLEGFHVKQWTGWYWGVETLIPQGSLVIGSGATVGLKGLSLGFALGYRKFRLFGYDSSYEGDADHAYPQPMNKDDLRVDIVLKGTKYVAARWMARQVVQFIGLAHEMTEKHGCDIQVFGDGLLRHAAEIAANSVKPAKQDTNIGFIA